MTPEELEDAKDIAKRIKDYEDALDHMEDTRVLTQKKGRVKILAPNGSEVTKYIPEEVQRLFFTHVHLILKDKLAELKDVLDSM